MKIGVDASCWVNNRGHGRYTRELLRTLLSLDHQNHYWLFLDAETARQCEGLPESERTRRVVVTTSQVAAQSVSAFEHRSLRDLWAMGQAVRQYGHHLDLFYFPSDATFFPLRTPAKVIITIHDAIPNHYPALIFPYRRSRFLWRLKLRCAVWQAHVIFTVSETAKRDIMKAFQLKESVVKVVPGAVSPLFHPLADCSQSRQEVSEYGIDRHERFILCVGSLSLHKNLTTVIDAYAALIQRQGVRNIKLVVAGDFGIGVLYSNYPALRERVETLGLSGKVIFTGFLSDLQLLYFYNAAELLVLASFDEGFGLPALEAMACGTPVVTSSAGALPEVIGKAGRYFNPCMVEELTTHLQGVLLNQPLREEMRRQGLHRAQAFSWERSARAALAVFEQLGKDPGVP